MKKFRGVISKKVLLSKKVMQMANNCKSLEGLSQKLQSKSIKTYYRYGKLKGVWLGKRKLRLATLGVGKEHLKQLTKEQERLDSINRNGQRKEHNRGQDIER